MGLLHGRAGRLNTKNGGFRPGQYANFAPYYPRLKAMGLRLYAFLGNVGGPVRSTPHHETFSTHHTASIQFY